MAFSKKNFLWIILGLLLSDLGFSQTDKIPEDFCISQKEYDLYQVINKYRSDLSLDAIPLSNSLSYVAKKHAADLVANYPLEDGCNMHSWSDKGDWKPFCFPADQSRKNDVKDKAMELTNYTGKAWELTYWDNIDITAEEVLSFWNSIPATAAMLSNTDKWSDVVWNSIGIGMNEGYVLVWLGKKEDVEPHTIICETGEKILNKSIPNELKVPVAASVTDHSNTQNVGQQKYYIIIGSFNRKADAQTAVDSYHQMGYPNALIVEEGGKIRVAIDYLANKAEADDALTKYREKFQGAWIFSK